MKKLDALFFVLLGLLTLAMLIMLALWVRTKHVIYLCFLLGIFAVYTSFIVFTLLRDGKDLRAGGPFRSKFLMLLNHIDSKVVFVAFLGNEKRTLKPSPLRKDYLIEFYEPQTNLEKLKKHVWFGLSEAEETQLKNSFIGGMDIPYSFLADIRERTVLIPNNFLQAVKENPLFSDFLSANELVPYGD